MHRRTRGGDDTAAAAGEEGAAHSNNKRPRREVTATEGTGCGGRRQPRCEAAVDPDRPVPTALQLLQRMGYGDKRVLRDASPNTLVWLAKQVIPLARPGPNRITVEEVIQLRRKAEEVPCAAPPADLDPEAPSLTPQDRRERFLRLYGVDAPTQYRPATSNLYAREGTRNPAPVCKCAVGTRCAEDCENRAMQVECVMGRCGLGDECTNNKMQRLRGKDHLTVAIAPHHHKGWGLIAHRPIADGELVFQYTGEVLTTDDEVANRCRSYLESGQGRHFYFVKVAQDLTLDATRTGSMGRFLNHSCEPSCQVEPWYIGSRPAVAVYAQKNLEMGDELTIDYDFEVFNESARQKCYCGTPSCRGFIGPRPKSLRPELTEEEARRKQAVALDKYREGMLNETLRPQLVMPTAAKTPGRGRNAAQAAAFLRCINLGQARCEQLAVALEAESVPRDPDLGLPLEEVKRLRRREQNLLAVFAPQMSDAPSAKRSTPSSPAKSEPPCTPPEVDGDIGPPPQQPVPSVPIHSPAEPTPGPLLGQPVCTAASGQCAGCMACRAKQPEALPGQYVDAPLFV